MRSPFPGMDPWLEHPSLWPNVHQRLITYASDALQAQISPRYYASIGERLYVEKPDRDVYPDVTILERGDPRRTAAVLECDEPTVVVLEAIERREVYIEIQDAAQGHKVVTVIEVLSPSNKQPGPGRDLYLKKQAEVLASDAHLIEIDLLRSGAATVALSGAKVAGDYRVVVSRAGQRDRREVYPVRLPQRLPRIKVPLVPPDKDVVLDLQALLDRAYENGAYGLRTDYSVPAVPPLPFEQAAWAQERVKAARGS